MAIVLPTRIIVVNSGVATAIAVIAIGAMTGVIAGTDTTMVITMAGVTAVATISVVTLSGAVIGKSASAGN